MEDINNPIGIIQILVSRDKRRDENISKIPTATISFGSIIYVESPTP